MQQQLKQDMEFDNNEGIKGTVTTAAAAGLDKDMAAFVGKNVEYYAGKWSAKDKNGNIKPTWNVAAFFGGPVWFAYRKMYWQAVAVFVGGTFLNLLLGLISDSLGEVSSYALMFAWAFSGNLIYRAHVEKAVERIRAEVLLPGERAEQLKLRGGTSAMAGWIASAVSLAILIFSVWSMIGAV
ncbi:DUF2628 domain-containing protein [Caballeronia sp. GAWG2-1]|uniref:DUF2628 domain-containing protein n=1 Tax=Caballeronia sp. GAWG2-1 TaxID=2921744 RepID=UPI0020283109|nr:DUF2628 domain-containing protein [Caballeronia sp. GAWG2-1]